MRSWIQIVEAGCAALRESRSAPLYHGTSVRNAVLILRSDRMEAGTLHLAHPGSRLPHDTSGVSLTRDRRVAAQFGPVVFELDQARLLQRHRVLPTDYWGNSHEARLMQSRRAGRYAEAEEFVVGDLPGVSRCLLAIHMRARDRDWIMDRGAPDSLAGEAAILLRSPLLRIDGQEPTALA